MRDDLDRDAGYQFAYTRGALSLPGFRPFDGMDDLDRLYRSDSLFPLVLNRLLPPSRPEYEPFLRWNGFDPETPPEPLLLLERAGGGKATDSIELFPRPIPGVDGCYQNYFFIHGMRYQMGGEAARSAVEQLRDGDRLELTPEPTNPIDPAAVAIRSGGSMLGYAPRYLARDFGVLLRNCPAETIRLWAHRINPDAPFQQRVLCRFTACWPEGFEPHQGEEFEPLVAVEPLPQPHTAAAMSTPSTSL